MLGNNNNQSLPGGPRGRIFIILAVLILLVILSAGGIYYAVLQEQKMQSIINVSGGSLQTPAGSLKQNSSAALQIAVSSTAVTDPLRLLAEKTGRPALGNPAAGLVIVEFADFECPICHDEFYQIREFVSRHSNEVYYIYRHYPIKGNNSMYLAKASMCANEQGKFWQFHDKLFIDQGQIESDTAVSDIAKQSGLSLPQFDQCQKADKYGSLIFEDMNDAVNLGAQGTPTFFVNGRKLEGEVTLADWEKILSKYEELNKGN